MTCPTCNDTKQVQIGIAVYECPDCTINISTMKKENTTWAQIIFVICVLAAMLLPSAAKAQTNDNAFLPVLKVPNQDTVSYWFSYTGIAGSRQWVVKETRYLEDVQGCYQLQPIEVKD